MGKTIRANGKERGPIGTKNKLSDMIFKLEGSISDEFEYFNN